MFKLTLKRKLSGRAIRKSIREAQKEPHLWPNRRKYWRNGPVGKKYPKALYEYSPDTSGREYRDIPLLIKKYKKEGKKGKLKRLYKLFPQYSPAHIEYVEWKKRYEAWQKKIKKNELCQSSK